MTRLPSFFESPHALAGFDTTESILVGLSGGADSVSLLHILRDYAKDVGCKIYAAHINHNIRTYDYNNEAERDEQFCISLCRELDIELFIKKVDIPSLAKSQKISLEGCARDERYKFFSSVMKDKNIKILSLAHNANDNLETQIFNLCRGSSVFGMEGIKKARELDGDGNMLTRPLILATKAQILDYCHKNNIKYVTDSTNFELDATRNKIRLGIIPELEKIFESCASASTRLSESAHEFSDFVITEVKKIIDEHLLFDGEKYIMPLGALQSVHIAPKKYIISDIFKKFDVSLEYVHIDAIINLLKKAIPHSSLSMPKGMTCAIENNSLEIYRATEKKSIPFFDVPLNFGLNEIDGTDFAVGVYSDNFEDTVDSVYTLYTYSYVKCDKMNDMHVRQRKSGDKILDGANTKSVKKLLCDKKVSLDIRDRLPIVCCGDEIIYIPLCAVSDSAKVNKEQSCVKICIYKKGN